MLPPLDKTVSWLKLVREKKLVEQTREHSRILPISSIYLKASFTSSFAQCLLTKGRQAVLPACCHKHTFHNENLATTFLRSSFKESYHFCSCLARMCSVTHCEFVKGLIDWLIDLEGTVQRAWVVSSSFSVLNILTHVTKMKWEKAGYLWDVMEEMWLDYILLLTFISLLYLMCNYVI